MIKQRFASPVEAVKHYGVKGMKWGVRNDRGHEGESVKTKKLPGLDKKWEKQFAGTRGWVNMHNAIANEINTRLPIMNNKPMYKNATNIWDGGKVQDAYVKDYTKALQDSLDAVSEKLGTNPSGTKSWVLSTTKPDPGQEVPIPQWKAELKEVKHAAAQPYLRITPKAGRKGLITGQEIKFVTPDGVAHTDETPFLIHYGVKGMRWGVSRAASKAGGAVKSAVKEANDARKARDAQIEKARADLPNTRAALKSAKKDAKSIRKEQGRKAARAYLKPFKDQHYQNWKDALDETSQEAFERKAQEVLTSLIAERARRR